jgi:hypothetical protein
MALRCVAARKGEKTKIMSSLVWTIRQGDTLRKTFTLYERASTGAPRVPINLTGAQMKIQIRPLVADLSATVLMELSTANGKIAAGASDGKVVVTQTDVSLSTGTGQPALSGAVFDIQITFAGGDIRTFPHDSNGKILLVKESTR